MLDADRLKHSLAVVIKNELEQKMFKQPISKDRNGEYRIGIKCVNKYHAELTIYKAKDGKYEKKFKCPAVIGKERIWKANRRR